MGMRRYDGNPMGKICTYFVLSFFILNPYLQALPQKKIKKKTHPCLTPKNPLCGNIAHLAPQIDLNYALKLSNHFIRVARQYKIPRNLLVAIAKQESNFKLEAIRMVNGLILEEGNGQLYKESQVGSDFCMMQINASNITRLKLDAHRLITEPQYCIEAGARILRFAQRHEKKEPTWWTRYNAVSDIHRTIYMEHVLKHWRKLDPQIDQEACQRQKK